MAKIGQPDRAQCFVCALALLLFVCTQVCAKEAKAVTSGLAEVNGTKLYYETAGQGRAVVLIHGGLVDSRLWDDQFRDFAKHYRVIRYDLRGFGKSEFPTTAFSHVEDLYALLKFLKVSRASLVGLSLGGMIATDFTLEHPEMVDALVLTSSGLRGDTSPRNERTVAVYKAAEQEGMERAIELWMEHPFFATGRNNRAYTQKVRRMLADNFKYWGPTPQPINLTWPKQPSIERLSAIKAPTLIIVGDLDAPNILRIAETLRTKITGAKKVSMSGTSHHLNMEKPREYNRIVRDFLRAS
ncbi:MAG TPA: alpha/beta hydrolase [Pyrinomonadaceae bacterium]|jgi:pimeloyl-ACP methyl ester carboxylesterase|nr:alpha/beta hydrolase [Pyrinomonadaceae bacterium]